LARESGRRAPLVFSDGEDQLARHDDHHRGRSSRRCPRVHDHYTEKEHGELTACNKYGIRVMDRIAKDTGGVHIDAELTYLNPSIAQLLKQPACAALV
jgi:hypothetical protein